MKRGASALAALLLAAGAYLGFSQQQAPPAEFPEEPPAVVHQLIAEPAENAETVEEAGEEEEDRRRSWRSRIRALWAQGGQMLFRLLIAGPLTFLGHGLAALATAAGGVLVSALKFILLEILGTFLALLIPLCLLFKALFPGRSLREFLTKKNLLRVLIAAVAVSCVTRLAEVAFPQVRGLRTAVKALLLLLAMVWLWYKTFSLKGRFTGRLRRLFWGPGGLAFLGAVAAGCCFTVWAQTGPLRGRPAPSGLLGTGMTYLLCGATAFLIFRRQVRAREKAKAARKAREERKAGAAL